MRSGKLPAAAIALAALGGIAAATPPARGDEVKVGIIASFSGPYADWGQRFQRAIDLFMAQHQSRVGDHHVTVVYRDDGGNNPGRFKQLAQELIVRDGVQYLAGSDFTPTALAVADVITQAKMPFVIFNSATSFVMRKSPYYIRTGFTLWQTNIPATEYATEHGAKKAVIVSADYAPGIDAIDSFTKGFTDKGGKIVDVIKVPMDTTDMSSYLQRVVDDEPDTLFAFMPAGPMSNALIKGWVDRGLQAKGVKYWGAGETEEQSLPAIGDAAVGVLSALNYAPYLDNPQNKKFLAAYRAAYGKGQYPNIASVAAWDGMQVVFHMIQATDGKRDPAKAMAAASGYKWLSPRGPVLVDPQTRDLDQNIYIREVEKVDGELRNKVLETFPMVKDPWVKLHPQS